MKIQTNVKAGLEVNVKVTSATEFKTSSETNVSIKI